MFRLPRVLSRSTTLVCSSRGGANHARSSHTSSCGSSFRHAFTISGRKGLAQNFARYVRHMSSHPSPAPHSMALWARLGTGVTAPSIDWNRRIAFWLFGCAGLVFAMVVIGGVTRITRSGLSMTSWSFLGGLPPIGEKAWEEEFERYKKFPEFKRINSDFTLADFKSIYFWEYAHRMFGRGIGLAFMGPLAYFWAKGKLPRYLKPGLPLLLAGGASQALIGWWMVRSGLDGQKHSELDLPRVSPYRLATHLISAFTIYAGLFLLALETWNRRAITKQLRFFEHRLPGPAILRRFAAFTSGLVGVTAMSGAFVAGTEAGWIYNQWPWMGKKGTLVPDDIISPYIKPKWKNLFENQVTVQFDHRMLAYLSLASCFGLFGLSRFYVLSPAARRISFALAGVGTLQVSLGIAALLAEVPPYLAGLHQAGSLTLLSVALMYWHALRRSGNAGRIISRHALAPSVIQRAPFRQFAAVNPPQLTILVESEPELTPFPFEEEEEQEGREHSETLDAHEHHNDRKGQQHDNWTNKT